MKNLRLLRQANKITQVNLQMKTGIEQSLLSKYENGERTPTTHNLIKLADYFNTSLDYIMDRTDIRDPYVKNQD